MNHSVLFYFCVSNISFDLISIQMDWHFRGEHENSSDQSSLQITTIPIVHWNPKGIWLRFNFLSFLDRMLACNTYCFVKQFDVAG